MGSGRSREELTSGTKRPRDMRRREQVHVKRLIALGVPAEVAGKLDAKQKRALLRHPEKTRKQYAPKA